MRILIFCALKEEAIPIVRILNLRQTEKLSRVYQGEFDSHFIRLFVTGWGRKNTESACDLFFKELPNLFISCGFAGGLDQNLKAGDTVLADQILFWEEGSLMDEPQTVSFKESYEKFTGTFQRAFRGTLLTTHRVIYRSEEKKKLAYRLKALAVDMESGYAAQYASKKGVPFLALRTITDTVDEDLKIDFSPWIDKNGNIRRYRMLRDLLIQPRQWSYFFQVVFSGIKAKKSLAESMKDLIKALPTS